MDTALPSPDWNAEEIIRYLKGKREPKNIEGMRRFGIVTDTALGISNTELRTLARKLKRDHQRSLKLWASDIREARLLASYTAEPEKVSFEQARAWASEFNSWEIVDGVSDLFVKAGLWKVLIAQFASDEREFVRRTAFAMMAWGAVHLKKEPDESILGWLPLIDTHASDARNFVRKAVNWALRQIGKRNMACHNPALALAEKLAASQDKTERWVGKDAVKELSSDKVLTRIAGK